MLYICVSYQENKWHICIILFVFKYFEYVPYTT